MTGLIHFNLSPSISHLLCSDLPKHFTPPLPRPSILPPHSQLLYFFTEKMETVRKKLSQHLDLLATHLYPYNFLPSYYNMNHLYPPVIPSSDQYPFLVLVNLLLLPIYWQKMWDYKVRDKALDFSWYSKQHKHVCIGSF